MKTAAVGVYVRASEASPETPFAYTDFEYERSLPEEWFRELRSLSPKSDDVGWLYLHWESGEPWVPGQRLVLYEMIHEKFVDFDILEELEGPHPRSEGHMCSINVPKQFQCLCRRKTEGWRGGPCSCITLTQWKLWRSTGYHATPFWIIQGRNGGHKWHFNEHEELMCKQADLPSSPPRLGALPYAPFDKRVVKQIVRHNRLTALGLSIAEFKRKMGPGYAAYKADVGREMRRQYLEYLTEQLREESDLFISAARKGQMDDGPKTTIDYVKLEEAASAHYVETGRVLHHTELK